MSFAGLDEVVERWNDFVGASWHRSILFCKLGVMYYRGIIALGNAKSYGPVVALLTGVQVVILLLHIFLSDLVFSKPINKSLLSLVLPRYIEKSSLFLLFSHVIFLSLCHLRGPWWIFISFIEIFYRSSHRILVMRLFRDDCLDSLHIFKESWGLSAFKMYKSRKLIVYLLFVITVFWHKWSIQILSLEFLFVLIWTRRNFLKSVSKALWSKFYCGT